MSEHDERASAVVGAIGLRHGGEGEGDADLASITDYLAGELDASAVAVVEQRLMQDEAFRRRAQPLMLAWRLREPTEPVIRDTEAETMLVDLWRRVREVEAVSPPRASVVPAPWWDVLPRGWMARVAAIGVVSTAAAAAFAYLVVRIAHHL
jgi:anti-sigma-K factor RskA